MTTSKQWWSAPRLGIAALTIAATLAALLTGLLGTSGSRAAAPEVAVFPIPGDQVATRATQLTFRGVPVAQLGAITVTGSKSGVHAGTFKSDSDGGGGSFLPTKPFQAGEKVTVRTALSTPGATNGTYSFTVQTPAHPAPARPLTYAPRTKGDVWNFDSRPDLKPAAVTVEKLPKGAAPGDLFVAPQAGPLRNGAELLGPYGGLLWFYPAPKNAYITDFREQTYAGKPVLTWWQGEVNMSGVGKGEDEIYNTSYRPVATIHAGNDLQSDLHEFQLTPQGTALVTAYQPVVVDASKIKHGSKHEIVLDAVVQDIDIKTGLVLFQWDSLDHVALGDSLTPVARRTGVAWDYFHVNSIQLQSDGSFVVSSRNTSAVYKISGFTAATEWTLGGRRSTFKMGKNTRFYFQHDARMRSSNIITLFDDAGQPFLEKQSRGLTLRLDTAKKTATLVSQLFHTPALQAPAEGNVDRLPNGDDLVGWGQANNFTEFNTKGNEVFDARFTGPNASYRAYRSPWTGTPTTRPAVATKVSGGKTVVYASWNGSSALTKWRVLGGSSAKQLKTVGGGAKRAFETSFELGGREGFVEVQALDSHGKVLASSTAVKG
ncbi:MAG: arylsulfotransferase family protein [Solirubrobacteraceae bacterium]